MTEGHGVWYGMMPQDALAAKSVAAVSVILTGGVFTPRYSINAASFDRTGIGHRKASEISR